MQLLIVYLGLLGNTRGVLIDETLALAMTLFTL